MADQAAGTGQRAFVGRERELSTLQSALESAERGDGGVYLLRGEAGIGKSRTAREIVVRGRERGFAVGIGHCLDGDAAPAYEPWLRALRDSVAGQELEARRRSDVPATKEDECVERDVEGDRDQLFRGVEAALRDAAAKRPQLLVLEDLHWADLDSLRLLQHLQHRLEGCAWMAICTQRDDEPGEARLARALSAVAREASTLPLGPLDESDVAALVADWRGRPADPDLARVARQRSGGNPLFLCELIALVIGADGDVTLSSLESAGVPAVLQQLMERRLERLGEDAAELLGRGAVLGDAFDLAELSSWQRERPDAVLAALQPAESLRLIEPTGEFADRFRFTHALVRDALLARMRRAQRAARHREVAALLEAAGRDRTESELTRLAEHHRHGVSPHSAERALECAAAAATLARRQGAPHQAVRHLQLALDSLRGVNASAEVTAGRRCELLLALGEARSQAGERDGAQADFLRAAEIAEQQALPDALARAAIGLVGRDEDPRGVGAEPRRWVERALEVQGRADTPLRAGLLALASRLAHGRGDAERGEALAREALDIAERLRRPDSWVNAAHALHYAIGGSDGPAERLALSQRMVEAAERGASRRTELRARQRHLTDLLQVGDTGAADEQLAHIEALARERGHPTLLWHAISLAAGRDIWRGRLANAERRAAEAYEQGRKAGMRNAQALFAVQMFHLREQQGRLAELRPVMQEMVEKNPQIRSLPLIIPLATMQEGDELLTRTAFEPLASRHFEDVPTDSDWLPAMCAHARVAAYLRDSERCDVLLEKLRPYDGQCVVLPDGQYWEGSVARHLALLEAVLGKIDEARAHFRAALDCHRRAGAIPLLAHTLHELGCFEAETGHDEAAAASLTEALALYRSLGIPLFISRSEAALEALSGKGSALPSAQQAPTRPVGRIERQGAQWTLEFFGRRAVVEHRKGMLDIACLVETPNREVHVLDLMTAASSEAAPPTPSRDEAALGAGPASLPTVDAAALAQYRARLAELRSERDEALARSDLAAGHATGAEIEWLEQELRRAFGAGDGEGGEFAQKARKAVYNRTRAAIAAIAAVHPELGRHLRHSIRTGVVCVYRPETDEEWLVRT